MATTFVDSNGDGQASRSFSFPSIKEADIKVDVDGTLYENRGITGSNSGATTFTINSYTTTGGGTVVFDTAPATSANKIRIFRDTDVDTAKATFTAGSSLKAGDLNLNNKQLLYAAQEEQNQTILSSDIKDGAIRTVDIGADQITNALIADNQIDSEHYVDGSIDRVHLEADIIDSTKLADNSVNSEHYVDGSIDHVHLANDIIDGDNIQDDVINSEHYAAGSIDLEHMSANSVDSDQYVDGSIDLIHMSANSVDSDQYVDGSIDRIHLEADIIDSTKLADNAVNSEHYVDGSIDRVHLAADIVDGTKIADDSIDSEHIAAGAVDLEHMSANSVDSDQYVDGSIDTIHIGNTQVIAAKLASNSVTESKITDLNVTTSKLADNAVSIAKIGCEQTTITNSDAHVPTSGAVVDYVAAQIAPIGGLEVVATDAAFPNVQPQAGVVISVSDAGGVVFNGSGSSTTARTVGGSTVTINGAPSSLNNETLVAGVGLMVSSTGSSQIYNYHKILGKESDIKQLSDDINDFNARYRVGSSNPTTALDSGDLFFNTGSGKLLVYNGTASAWEEAQSIGQYFINTISSSSGTGGGSATFNNNAYRFTLSNAGAVAEQHIVSVNGVVQKPNSGTSQPSEGFAIDGADIIFSSAPPNGADFFIITIGSTVNIGTPSNGTVTAAKLASGAVETAKIADGAVTEAKLGVSNSPTNGYFLSAQSGNSGGLTWAQVTTDLVGDTSPQLGGDLASNSHDIKFADDDKAIFGTGTGNDLEIFHESSSNTNEIKAADGDIHIQADNFMLISDDAGGRAIYLNDSGGHLELGFKGNHDARFAGNQVTFLTNVDANAGLDVTGNITVSGTVDGVDIAALNTTVGNITTDLVTDTSPQLGGDLQSNGNDIDFADGDKAVFGTGSDLIIKHDNANWIESMGTNTLNFTVNNGSEYAAQMFANGAVKLRYDNLEKFETTSTGAKISGTTSAFLEIVTTSGSHNPMFRGSNGDRTFDTGLRGDSGDAWCVYDVTAADNRFMITTGGDVSVPNDNKALMIGAGNDIQLYHNNGNNYIYAATNSALLIGTNNTHRWTFNNTGEFKPAANNTYDIGTSSARVRNIYTNDLHLSNEGSSNDVDGTWGNWTIQEGESDLFLKNNRSGKKYKFNLTEIS